MDRRIILAVLIFLVVVLLVKHAVKSAEDAAREAKEAAGHDISDPSVNGPSRTIRPGIAVYDSVPLTTPSTTPIYTSMKIGNRTILIADYTGVPVSKSGPLKCAENIDTYIIDLKYVPVDGDDVRPENLPENLIKLDPDLAVAMAGLDQECGSCMTQKRTPESVQDMWIDPTGLLVGLILERARETVAKLKQNLIDQNVSDYDIANKYNSELTFMKNLPVDTCCEDLDDKCKAWSENNLCVVNPEQMLKNCPKSCGSCSYSSGQITKLTQINMDRTIPNCASDLSKAGELALAKITLV